MTESVKGMCTVV